MPASLRVLVVDDDAGAANGLLCLLEGLGHMAVAVSDGRQALDLLPTFHPHIAFIDINMPGMDGYEVAHRIGQVPEYSATLLVAFTSFEPAEVALNLRNTFDHHLPKPFRVEALQALLKVAAERCGH